MTFLLRLLNKTPNRIERLTMELRSLNNNIHINHDELLRHAARIASEAQALVGSGASKKTTL